MTEDEVEVGTTTLIHKMEIILVRDGRQVGDALEFRCPICKETLTWVPYAWWQSECDCGFMWHVDINAVGIQKGGFLTTEA